MQSDIANYLLSVNMFLKNIISIAFLCRSLFAAEAQEAGYFSDTEKGSVSVRKFLAPPSSRSISSRLLRQTNKEHIGNTTLTLPSSVDLDVIAEGRTKSSSAEASDSSAMRIFLPSIPEERRVTHAIPNFRELGTQGFSVQVPLCSTPENKRVMFTPVAPVPSAAYPWPVRTTQANEAAFIPSALALSACPVTYSPWGYPCPYVPPTKQPTSCVVASSVPGNIGRNLRNPVSQAQVLPRPLELKPLHLVASANGEYAPHLRVRQQEMPSRAPHHHVGIKHERFNPSVPAPSAVIASPVPPEPFICCLWNYYSESQGGVASRQ